MLDFLEDSRNEFKEVLNEKLEKEIVGFLNSNGGNLYIGVDDNGNVIGLNDNIDELQLKIKDRIKKQYFTSNIRTF